MAKKTAKRKSTTSGANGEPVSNRMENVMASFIQNEMTLRSKLMSAFLDPRRDFNNECGYPDEVDIEHLKIMYRREGIATRVVSLFPDECWKVDPSIYETPGSLDTEFEKALHEVLQKTNLFHYWHKVDELSGIGRFGVLLIGFSDLKGSEGLDKPVPGIDERGEATEKGREDIEVVFLRAFDETQVKVSEREKDMSNPRFTKPKFYTIDFDEPGGVSGSAAIKSQKVHWTRVVHVADNCKSSEIFGTPRMEPNYNRLLDLRKLLGGSAEMFWKGAFPGYSFEMNPDLVDGELNVDEVREEFEAYANGLQRFLAIQGLNAKSLDVQVASPKDHVEVQLRAISINMKCPLRIFMGSEAAHQASIQDKQNWNERVAHRQNKYCSPRIIRETIDRFIAAGVLPTPGEDGYKIEWPDLETPTEQDKAAVLKLVVEAISLYIKFGMSELVPPLEFLTVFLKMSHEEATAILDAAFERMKEEESEEDILLADDEEEEEPSNAPQQGSEFERDGDGVQEVGVVD